ncbi:MAG: efflux RND transporter periplasmic adaptor subunit [Pseudomonadota bacterium]
MNRIWLAALALSIGGCTSAGDSADTAADPVALVKLAVVTQGGAGRQITVYGAAEPGAMGKMSLVAPAEAKVVAIDAPVGTHVAQGQVIVRLAASPVTRADAAKATSDAAAANAAFARAQRLRADGLVSNAEVETARAAATSANALRASFVARASGLTLRAPAAGVVDAVTVATGDMLQPGAAVASVTRVGDVRVRFGVDPDTARLVRPGMVLRIGGDAARAPVTVPIESVSTVVDPQTRLAAIFARMPANSNISAGQALTATIDSGDSASALSIPYAALLDDAGQPYVYVVTGGVAHRRDVATETSSGDRVTIVKGLRLGDRIVVEGGTAVEDGMKVRTR